MQVETKEDRERKREREKWVGKFGIEKWNSICLISWNWQASRQTQVAAKCSQQYYVCRVYTIFFFHFFFVWAIKATTWTWLLQTNKLAIYWENFASKLDKAISFKCLPRCATNMHLMHFALDASSSCCSNGSINKLRIRHVAGNHLCQAPEQGLRLGLGIRLGL